MPRNLIEFAYIWIMSNQLMLVCCLTRFVQGDSSQTDRVGDLWRRARQPQKRMKFFDVLFDGGRSEGWSRSGGNTHFPLFNGTDSMLWTLCGQSVLDCIMSMKQHLTYEMICSGAVNWWTAIAPYWFILNPIVCRYLVHWSIWSASLMHSVVGCE